MKIFLPALFLLFTVRGFSQWNFSPAMNTSVCVSQLNDQQDVRIVTDGKGGAIIAWVDFRNNLTLGDIFCQRLNSAGIPLWTVNGIGVCTNTTNQTAVTIVEDGASGVILAWNDFRNGLSDIYAQKIDSSGTVLWAVNGLPVCAKAGTQQDAKLISDGTGGAFAVWQDSSAGAFDIYAQRIMNVGTPAWAGGGMSICNATNAQINPRIETDNAGGSIITWQDKRGGLDYDIYAQRINSAGVVQWTANGIVVCNATGTQSNPKIEPDGSGGAYIGWQDKRSGDYDIYANRIGPSGTILWNTNGWGVSVEAGSQSALDMTSEGVSGVYFTWKDNRNGTYDIYYQRADANGAMQFSMGGNSISLAPFDQLNPNIVGDGAGGAIVVWQDSSAGNWNIKTQRVDASGSQAWAMGGVDIGTAADNQTNPKSVSDGNGGCIYAWQDKRNPADFDIYAHHLYTNGTTSGINEKNGTVLSKCFPNPFSSSATIEFENTGYEIPAFEVYDFIGIKVELPFIISQNKLIVSRGELPNGMYLFEIRLKNGAISKGKLILTD